MDDILDHATDYAAVIYTAGFGDLAAAGGRLTYPYETATLDVTTRLCPYAIRTEATLLGNEDQCDPIVLAVHDVAGDHPGYTDVNYGGVKAYDHLVTDAMSLDATISDASLQGMSGACPDPVALGRCAINARTRRAVRSRSSRPSRAACASGPWWPTYPPRSLAARSTWT